jgi:hypothetical protein
MMMDDNNSILDAATAGCKDGSSMMSDYLGGFMSSLHNALDPSAIITPQAVREFGRDESLRQPRRGSQFHQQASSSSSHKTPRSDPPQVRVNPFAPARKPKFQFAKHLPDATFGTVTTYRPQEQARDTKKSGNKKATDMEPEKDNDEASLTLLPNASSLTMEMMTDDDRQQTEDAAPHDSETPRTPATDSMDGRSHDDSMAAASVNPYDGLLKMAAKNTRLMEQMRDEVNQLRVQNAMLINDLAMVSFDSYSSDVMDMAAA